MTWHADLHVHTAISDGVHPPNRVVALAHKAGLRALAITDHDALAGIAPAVAAGRSRGIEVIAGVEISAVAPDGSDDGVEVHILGYFVDAEHVGLRERLEALRAARRGRAAAIHQRLLELGVAVPYGRIAALAGAGSIGRPHIAAALCESGHVHSVQEAFERYLASGRPAYVPRAKVEASEAIGLLLAAGGLPALAHPWSVARLVPWLAAQGLKAIEVRYPGYGPLAVHYLRLVARRHGLLLTGGSDYHGPPVSEAQLGAAGVTAEELDALRAACPATESA